METQAPSQLPVMGVVLRKRCKAEEFNRLLQLSSTPRRKSEAHHPPAACGSESWTAPPARNQPHTARDESWASQRPLQPSSPAFSSLSSSLVFQQFIQRQRGACCGELERSPVSAGALEADFCSRLVGWGDKTELSDTTPAEHC